MQSVTFEILALMQVVFLILSIIWFLKRNDEVPAIISLFLLYISSYRFWAVTQGLNEWVTVAIGAFDPITDGAALESLQCMVLGEFFLLTAYCSIQTRKVPQMELVEDRQFLNWLGPKVIFLGLLCFPLVIWSRVRVSEQFERGASMAFNISNYVVLFPMVLVGVAVLVVMLWKSGFFHSFGAKILAGAIFSAVYMQTFSPQGRFQFVGWMIASGTILTCSYKPLKRLTIFAMVGTVALALFSFAGILRYADPSDGRSILEKKPWERAFSAEDANMIDGFAMLRQVYPGKLPFSMGGEHLEILLRPIPRSLWPDKPVGGYMNKLDWTTEEGGGTLGISPSLFGSFFSEGGEIGIMLLAVIYGVIIAKIVRFSVTLHPFASVLIRAIVCASLIPLLRGGDLPGIYAWFGMAFWPCFLLLWNKRRYFSKAQAV